MKNASSVRASTRGLQPVDHLAPCSTSALFGTMAAALELHLVLDVHRGSAVLDQALDETRDAEDAAEARVDVDQQRQRARVGEPPHLGQHVGEVRDREIGQAVRIRREAAAGEIDRLVADALGHHRAVRIDRADDRQRVIRVERGAKARAGA